MPVAMPSSRLSDSAHEVIESVVALTEQRDELTLLRSLLETILEMLPDAQAVLVWLVPGAEPGKWIEDASCPLPQLMFRVTDGLLAEIVRLDAQAPMRQHEQDGQCYLINNLGIQESRRRAIVIRQPEWTPADLRIAQGMIKIHANYAKLLFDSERDTLTGL